MRNLSIPFRFSSLLMYRFLKYVLRRLWISSVCLIISTFSSLVLLIWIFFLSHLVHLGKDLLILLIFLKEVTLCSMGVCIVLFVCSYFIGYIPEFDGFLPSTPFGHGFYVLQLSIWDTMTYLQVFIYLFIYYEGT